MIVLCPKITFKQITSKKRSSFLIPSFITVATYQALQKRAWQPGSWWKWSQDGQGPRDFWVKMTQKFGKEAIVARMHICNCWIHLWMRSAHSGAAAVFVIMEGKKKNNYNNNNDGIMEGAILLVSVSVMWANDQHRDHLDGQLNLVLQSFNSTFPEPAYWWNRGIKEQLKFSDYKRPCIRILGIVEDNMGRVNPSRDEVEGEG